MIEWTTPCKPLLHSENEAPRMTRNMMKFFTRSFQARMIYSILIIAGLTWVLGLTVIYIFGKSALEKSIGLEFQHTAEETSKNLTRLLERYIIESYSFTSSPDILNALR